MANRRTARLQVKLSPEPAATLSVSLIGGDAEEEPRAAAFIVCPRQRES
jgi:hypothetical protein